MAGRQGPPKYVAKNLRKRATNHVDHVVELQIVAAALNNVQPSYIDETISYIVSFFNELHNLQLLPADKNQEKGAAIKRYLKGIPKKENDDYYISMVKIRWRHLKPEMRDGLENLKRELDNIMKTA